MKILSPERTRRALWFTVSLVRNAWQRSTEARILYGMELYDAINAFEALILLLRSWYRLWTRVQRYSSNSSRLACQRHNENQTYNTHQGYNVLCRVKCQPNCPSAFHPHCDLFVSKTARRQCNKARVDKANGYRIIRLFGDRRQPGCHGHLGDAFSLLTFITPQYARLTSSPLHTAYTVSLLLTSLTLLTLHLVSLSTTHASISKLSTLLSLARPENSPVIIPTVSSQDGQPVLQLCNVGQSNCQVISSVAPSATATSTPEPIEPQAASPSPATTAQESNAQITPVADVGVQGNGVVSVSVSQSSTSTGVIIAAPPATTSTLISSSSSTGLFIAEVPLPTTAVKEGTEPSLLTAPTLVLNTPTVTSTSISTEATLNITSTSSETLRETSTSTLSTTTTTAESTTTTTESTTTREINAETTSTSESIATYTSSETLQETSTSELSTSTSLIAQSTASETANSTSTSALADATPNEISASTTQSLPPLPTAQLTTANETSTTSQTATSAVESIQVIAPGTPSTLQLPRRGALRRRAFSATAVVDGANGAVSGIDVTDVQDVGGSEVTRLGVVCALAMAFPELQ